MANKKYEETDVQAIATAIREKTGSEKTYKVSEMDTGVAEVYEKGKKTESIAFLNAITNNGARQIWTPNGFFSYTDFSDIEFAQPLVIAGETNSIFRQYAGKKLPRKQDIDMTGVTSAMRMFSFIYGGGRTITIPDYGIPAIDKYEQTYDNAQVVETIEIIRCHEGTTFPSNTFATCPKLKNVTFDGVIGTSITFSSSPLTVESMKNIIEHLKDYTGTTSEFTYTITFSSACTELLSSIETSYTPQDGSSPIICNGAELIAHKKWTLG